MTNWPKFLAYLLASLLALTCSCTSAVEAADALPPIKGDVVLTVGGAITIHNSDMSANLTLDFLKTLPAISITTETPWTAGSNRFKGVLLRDLLARLNATGTVIEAGAGNDYFVDIPVADATAYDVIIAYEMNGAALDPAARGPLWVMYPYSSHSELQDDSFYSRAIWQLNRMTIK